MSAPRLEVHLGRLHHNAQTLVERLGPRGIAVTGVTKATSGSPEVAAALVAAGVSALGESRVEGLERLRAAQLGVPLVLLCSPMPSQVERVVAAADVSCNTEPGDEVRFGVGYRALLRAMTSPLVEVRYARSAGAVSRPKAPASG